MAGGSERERLAALTSIGGGQSLPRAVTIRPWDAAVAFDGIRYSRGGTVENAYGLICGGLDPGGNVAMIPVLATSCLHLPGWGGVVYLALYILYSWTRVLPPIQTWLCSCCDSGAYLCETRRSESSRCPCRPRMQARLSAHPRDR